MKPVTFGVQRPYPAGNTSPMACSGMAPLTARIPYGMAKAIVGRMEIGDRHVVRPEHLIAFHNAARRLGLRLATTSFRRDGHLRHWIVRIALEWRQDGRAMMRLPRRHRTAGRFMAA